MKACNTEELYTAHRSRLLYLIESKVQDAQQAEDLLHDSFEKLENCCAKGCVCNRPKSYLFRMVMNAVADFFNKRKKNRNTQSILTLVESKDPNPSTKSCELLSCLTPLLEELSEANRQAFTLVDIQQQSQVEVAKNLGISLSTLKSRVQRTRKILRHKLEVCCPDFRTTCK